MAEKLSYSKCPKCGCDNQPRNDWEYVGERGRHWFYEHYTCLKCGARYTEQYMYISTYYEEG